MERTRRVLSVGFAQYEDNGPYFMWMGPGDGPLRDKIDDTMRKYPEANPGYVSLRERAAPLSESETPPATPTENAE